MMGDNGDWGYLMNLASATSRASSAQSFNHQHQRQLRTHGNSLDPTDIGNVHNINQSNTQQRHIRGLQRELVGVPPGSYGNTRFPTTQACLSRIANYRPAIGEEQFAPNASDPANSFNNGFGPGYPRVAPPLLHSGGPSNLGLDDAPSLSIGNTGIATTATSTSEAGRTSQHRFNGPSRSIQVQRQLNVPGSGQLLYPLERVDDYNVPNYGPRVPAAAPSPRNHPGAVPHLNGSGQGAQFQDNVSELAYFASGGNIGTNGHSDYTHNYVPHGQPMTYISPSILTATDGAVSSDVAYSDRSVDFMDDLEFSQLQPAGNAKSHPDKATFGSFGDNDILCHVGGGVNTPPNLSFHQTTQQNIPDDRHGQANYTATGPPFGHHHRPLNSSAGYQGEDVPNFTCVVQTPDSHIVAGVVDTEAHANPVTPLSATGSPSARAEPRPPWQAHMATQVLTQRNPQVSQSGPTKPTTLNNPPSGPLRAESDRHEASPKERGRRRNPFSQEQKDAFKRRKSQKTVCVRCRCSHAVV